MNEGCNCIDGVLLLRLLTVDCRLLMSNVMLMVDGAMFIFLVPCPDDEKGKLKLTKKGKNLNK